MKKQHLIVLGGVLLFFIGFSSGCVFSWGVNMIRNYKTEKIQQSVENKIQAEASIKAENGDALVVLKDKLNQMTAQLDGEWAVYVEDLRRNEKFEINNKKMVSASLIKLFIMGKTYEEIGHGTIEKDDVTSLLKNMITVSDNEASNELVAKLGGGKYTDMKADVFKSGMKMVNQFALERKCTDTEQQRDMKNSRPEPVAEQNYTSVRDCGVFLSRLYHGELVSPESDVEMLELLKQQTRRGKIPSGLGGDAICANKTGELSDVENDAAIVFSPGTDYVICVMSNDVSDTAAARENIVKISKTVYDFFN